MSKGLEVGKQLSEILNDFGHSLDDTVKKEINATAKEAVDKLRNTSPKNTGDYARGWRSKRQTDGSVVIHNATDYQLTHLLENGHVIKNKKGTYGRVNGIKHIEPVEQWANEEVVQRIEKKIEEGLV